MIDNTTNFTGLIARGNKAINERYRHCTFHEVIGNENTKKALAGWIEKGGKRSSTILLTGNSGNGKTTTARILAMGLNCENGDTVNPCCECPSCKSALSGEAMHITEYNMSALSKKEDADEIVNSMYNSSFTGRNNVYILDECLHYNTNIDCFINGKVKKIPIGHIVHKKMKVNVLSYNSENKMIEIKPVINWFKNPKKKVYEWVFERENEPGIQNHSKKIITCTENHTVFLSDNNKEIQIGMLKPGDIIRGDYISVRNRIKSIQNKREEFIISEEVHQFLLGTLLGDSSIVKDKSGNYARICGIHCEKQFFYAMEKKRLLGNLFASGKEIENNGFKKKNKIIKKAYCFRTKSRKELNKYYDLFKKDFDIKNILNQLNEIGIAFWYMDDGSLSSNGYTLNLSTHSYTEKENDEIIKFFLEKYNIQFKKILDKRINKYSLYCCGKNKNKFLKLISPYILNEFQYKCGKIIVKNKTTEIHPVKFIGFQEGNFVTCNYRFVEKRYNPKKNERGHVYDIEVADNHNYFASGINVHNCQGMSTSSQNLMLKILENPPVNTYIILATTDPQKILKTIKTRCEQYEFKNPSYEEIKKMLGSVVKQEMPDMNIDQRKQILESCKGLGFREILMKLEKFLKGGGTDNIAEVFQTDYTYIAKLLIIGNYLEIINQINKNENDFDIESARRIIRVFLMNQMDYCMKNNQIEKAKSFLKSLRIFDKGFYSDPNPMPSFKADLIESCLIILNK